MKNSNSNLKSMLVEQAETEAKKLVKTFTLKGETCDNSEWVHTQEGWSYIGWPIGWDDYCDEELDDGSYEIETLMDIYYKLNPDEEWAPQNTPRLSEEEKLELIEKAYDIMGITPDGYDSCFNYINADKVINSGDWFDDFRYATGGSFILKYLAEAEDSSQFADDLFNIYENAVYEICNNNIENISNFIAGFIVNNYGDDIQDCAFENIRACDESDEETENEPVLVNM